MRRVPVVIVSVLLTLACVVQSSQLLEISLDEKSFCFWATGALMALGINDASSSGHYSEYSACVYRINHILIPWEYWRNIVALIGKLVLLGVAAKRVHKELTFK